MIITYFGIIVFHLAEWVCAVGKSLTRVLMEYGWNMLAFSYLAISTRHEVSDMPMFGDII